jgi:hypothetical protein
MAPSPQVEKLIQSKGFRKGRVRGAKDKRLWIGSEGLKRTGKTDFMLRTTPGPVGHINIDLGTDDVEEKMVVQLGRDDLYFLDIPLPATRDIAALRPVCEEAYIKIHEGITDLCASGAIRTLCVDTGDAVWRILRIAEQGAVKGVAQSKYDVVNAMMTNLMMTPQNHGIHFICSHKLGQVWAEKEYVSQGEVRKIRAWTGEYEREGFQHTQYIFRVNIRHESRPMRVYNKATKRMEDGQGLEFGFRILDCTANPDITGMELWGDEATFPGLGVLVYPDTELEDWT